MELKKVQKIEKSRYSGKVFNLEVDIDNSYVTNIVTLHNCRPSASKDVLFDRATIDKQIVLKPLRTVNGLHIYKEYDKKHRYALGADIALGVGLDSSTTVIMDLTVGEVVAVYWNNEVRPAGFADVIKRHAEMYGTCYVAPEKNNAGVSTIDRLKQIYPISRIHATQRRDDKIQWVQGTEFGWDTNPFTKPKMLNDLASAVEMGLLVLNSEELIRECRSYTRNDLLDREADARMATRHFDIIMAAAIAWQMKDFAPAVNYVEKYVDPFADLVPKPSTPTFGYE